MWPANTDTREIDLGVGGKTTDRVHVVFPDGLPLSNIVVLIVMNEQRLVVLEHLFLKLTTNSPQIQDFTIGLAPSTENIPDGTTKMVRYIRLTRTHPYGSIYYMNEYSLEVYLGSRSHTYFAYKYVRVTVDILPLMEPFPLQSQGTHGIR
jgi:hypothetical protein